MDWNELHFLVFMLCCLFNLIVLLNLLIAIISKTFDDLGLKETETGYREKAIQMN